MSAFKQWLVETRDWLDSYGRQAWIAVMVLSFIFLGPFGLVVLFYMIGTNRMKPSNFGPQSFGLCLHRRGKFGSTGNAAFDNYRDETLKRLEEEQANFGKFMENLRAAKDKAEFDQFMENREKQGFEDVPPAPKNSGDFGAMPNPA
jgi:hypothetical protein